MKRPVMAASVVLLVGCGAKIDGPAPVVSQVESDTTGTGVICTCKDLEAQGCEVPENGVVLSIIGSGFAPLPVGLLDEPRLELPDVILRHAQGTELFFDGVDPSALPAGTRLDYKDDSTLLLTFSKEFINTMAVGHYDVIVVNPNGNQGTLEGGLEVTLGPVLTSVAPSVVCNERDTQITLTGKHFRDGATVYVDNKELVDVQVVDDETITATVPRGLNAGPYNVRVVNPEGCFSTLVQALQLVPPPTLTGVVPPTVCTGGSVTLTGSGFVPGTTTVTIGTVEYSGTAVTVTDDETLTVNDLGPLLPGTYDVSATNAGCNSNTLAQALTVEQGPIIVAVDPSTVYNQVAFPITIFGSGFGSDSTVQIETSPDPTQLTVTGVTDDRIDAIVPHQPNPIPPGVYDITVIGPGGCKYTFPGALTVTDQLTVRVCGIDPPFGWDQEDTDVTVISGDASTVSCPPCATCTQQFVSTPRAWLDVNGTLQPLKAVAFVTPTTLTGTVPEGLTVGGPYDLLVQNPDGGIGLLEGAFRVVDLPVPQIDSINPGDADTQYVGGFTLFGKNFRSQAKVELIGADGTVYPVTTDATLSNNGTQADTTLDVATLALAPGPYLVRLTNTDQDTYYDFSALAITNPSGNLEPWQTAATSLITGRRRHAMVSGRLSAAARFLYVIGGDPGGTSPAPMASVELCPLDKFGGTGDWVAQRYQLSTPRTSLAAVAKGRYLYVIGGEGPAGDLATVERAVILDPAEAPEIDSFSFSLGGTLAKGAWYYRVAAVMASTHADNPDGESLPSDPVIVHAIDGVKVSLSWQAVPDAVYYRVYRSPAENASYGEEQLLADNITATSYEDTGGAIADPAVTPLVKGSTGVFVELAGTALATARSAMSATIATVGNADYVYVVGGRAGTTVLDSIEQATITTDGVTLGAFAPATTTLITPRERLMIGVADENSSPSVPTNTVWLYVAGGANASVVKDGSISTLGASGAPGAFSAVDAFKSLPVAATGYMINDTFYYFGGSDDGTTAQTSGFSCTYATNPAPPQFKNCNNLGPAGVLPAATMNASLTLESAFFYISGGGATDGDATTNVFKTVY